MQEQPFGWFRHLTIGQKLLVSFGAILTVLVLSFGTLLLYLAHVNSYVDRHQRITVPAVITAAELQQNLSRLRAHVHSLVEHRDEMPASETLRQIEILRSQMVQALMSYRSNHAARTHPILFGMLTQHDRIDLADREDQAIVAITDAFKRIDADQRLLAAASQADRPDAQRPAEVLGQYDETLNGLERNIATLIDVHRQIDIEMKIEGDRLVNEARLIVASVTALLALLIIGTYVAMRRWIAEPLRRLSITADRVAHQDLRARFEPWPHRDEVGVLAASLSSMLTNLREQTAGIIRKTKELEAFTYSVAHDLKGPLREIEGFSSILEKQLTDSVEADRRHYVHVIRQSALRLTHMIDGLLKYSRLEQQDLPRSRFNMIDTIHGLITDRFANMPEAKPAIQVDVPFTDLYGEPVTIRQALANLVDNAAKFSRRSPAPAIHIGGRRTSVERILWVRDNGIGISPDQHEKVFSLFERLHAPEEYEGTGVGLAIVKMVVEKHGGRVWVESAPGAGSTFYLAFPDPAE
ncbi:MAG TPA: ATP-binding protein [Nitrospiraceae bacterium]|nr:ATP-binding protein [Nitrospiraceae bacterium]